MAYTDFPLLPITGEADTNIYVRSSDDGGKTWTEPVLVNDDPGTNSQILPALAVLSFLISILAGVAYSYYLCQKTDRMEIRVPKLDLASMALHVFFAIGVLLFSAWAFLMIFELR